VDLVPRLTGDKGVGGSRARSRALRANFNFALRNWIEGSTINPDKIHYSTIHCACNRTTGAMWM
jgi:hypothetical protein